MRSIEDLRDLKMHLRVCSLLLCGCFAFADSSLLSALKQDEIKIDRDLANKNADKLGNDWISTVTASYTKGTTELKNSTIDTEQSSISIVQPIFKSGGIYFAIKYADSVREYSNISVDIKQRELEKSLLSLVFNLHKLNYQIKKQKLLVENSKIDVSRKQEQFKEGVLDSSYLDNALLTKNANENTLLALYEQKKDLEKSLSVISDLEYQKIILPTYKIPSKRTYLNNIDIYLAKSDISQKEYLKKMTISNQLITLNANGTYLKDHESDMTYKTYGLSISMPIIDPNIFNKVSVRSLSLQQSENSLMQIKKELEIAYDTYIDKISLIDKKISISQEDHTIYQSLLKDTEEKYSVGLVTIHDVDTLKNSKQIKELDKKIYQIDKNILLVQMYSKVVI
jgi:outer membrane protein TolC